MLNLHRKVIFPPSPVLTVGIEDDSVTVREGVNGSVTITIVGDIQASFQFHVFLYPVNGTAESTYMHVFHCIPLKQYTH